MHYESNGVPQAFLDILGLDNFQLGNLKRLGEFKTLCDAVGPKRWCDAFHLWTALCNGLDYFLTTDEKFLRVLRNTCTNVDLLLPAVCPSELVDALHLPPVPLPIQEGEVIPFPFD